MEFETLKGTKDYALKEAKVKDLIITTLKTEFMKNGFRPFQTPHIEYFDTLTHKYDEDAEIVQEIFNVSDRGERKLALRYDLTIPLCRFLAQNIKSLKLPFRRFHIGSVFRDGPIKKGRLREFEQCDCDVVGLKGQDVEIELMELFYRCYTLLGIESVLKLNSIKILQGALYQNEFKSEDMDSVILSIDKLNKIGKEGVAQEVISKGYSKESIMNSIQILSAKSFDELKKLASNEILLEGIEELETLVNGCEKLEVNIEVDFSMARGHSYYTGNIWEAFDLKQRVRSSIGGGGRYDKGISNYIGSGDEIPAMGISFGIVGILEILMEKYKQDPESLSVSDVLIAPFDSSLVVDCLDIAKQLREDGKNVEMYYGYKLKKAFEYANSIGVKEIIVFGNKDKELGEYKIKNLESGEERVCKL